MEWLRSDGFAAVAGRRFEVIAANPPYLSEADLAAAPPELGFEPAEALVAGPTGLEAIDRIAAEAPEHLEPGGRVLIEVGDGQAPAAEEALRAAGLAEVARRADLAGVERVVGGARSARRERRPRRPAAGAARRRGRRRPHRHGLRARGRAGRAGRRRRRSTRSRDGRASSRVRCCCSAPLLAEALGYLDPLTRRRGRRAPARPGHLPGARPAGPLRGRGGRRPRDGGPARARVDGPAGRLDLPLVATSANEPGGPDPARLEEVPAGLRAAATFDAGPLPGTASTVVDLRALAAGGAATLVRPGPDPAGVARALAGWGALA